MLAVPGRSVVQDEVNFEKFRAAGDSLIAVPDDVRVLKMDLSDGAGNGQTVIVNANGAHRLRDVELDVQADSFENAAAIGHDLIWPMLSRWAYLHDVAITVSAVQIVEMATQAHSFSLMVVGAIKAFADTAGISEPEHRVLLSAYRDGVSSTEPLWQALSFFRVAEGVQALRNARIARLVASGAIPNEPSERVQEDLSSIGAPNDVGLADSLLPFVGQKFTRVLDDIRPTLRNAIAHMSPDDGSALVQDRWEDLQRIERALPGLRWIARQMLDAELQASA